MALMDARAVFAHAKATETPVPLVEVREVTELMAAVDGAARCGAPLALGLPPVEEAVHEPLAAAAEVVAERSEGVVLLHQGAIDSEESAMLAINRGATSLGLHHGLEAAVREAVTAAAGASGVAVVEEGEPPLQPVALPPQGETLGQVLQALADWSPWEGVARREAWRRRPVDHVIVFNVDGLGEAGVQDMLQEGARVLGAIPGVRDLAAGASLKDDAAYRYHWMVRFAHPDVVPYYRDHPAHVAFADGLFRPVAGNRVSIDYVHWARARGGRPLGD